jgi:hypothetical protein
MRGECSRLLPDIDTEAEQSREDDVVDNEMLECALTRVRRVTRISS